MGLWVIIRRRWRMLLWVAVLALVAFNAAIFLGVTGPRVREELRRTDDSPHLQVSRKRLNKSAANSSIQNNDDHEPKGGVVDPEVGVRSNKKFSATPAAEAEVKDNHPNGGEDDPESTRGKKIRGDKNTYRDKEVDEDPVEGQQPLVVKEEADHQFVAPRQGRGHGGRANYTITEVDSFVEKFQSRYADSAYEADVDTKYQDFLKRLNALKKKGSRLDSYINNMGKYSWEHFHHGIRQYHLYDPAEGYVEALLKDMATKEIVDVEQKEGGTQIKLMITLEDDGQSLMKPMRFPRDQETLPDHFYFADYERHNAEIAAFHLDMLLGFYRVPPTIGREVNVSRDLHRLANRKLAKTFFISPAGNWCFHGSCSYYCDSSHPICGHPIMLEGSLAAFLPPLKMAKRKTWRNPWKRSYSKHRKAYWEVYDDLCEKVKDKHPYNEGRRLLDIMDMAVFDFLTGNLDRHHYETFQNFGNDTFLLHLDNGRAFGKSNYDCVSCIAPVRQCCMIRLSTLTKLIKLYVGPDSLSQLMRLSLQFDPLNPILYDPHLDALDRRVSKVLHLINSCLMEGKPWDEVIVDDGIT
ncbi:unnamed protein product [Lymnaea stagnalis]|uniref:FAM20 C-terminal domain-containing protein n=1 Tax=Lymnaea stagnalis TaxID=6523 RepID=A0AAV2I8T6_LYMST